METEKLYLLDKDILEMEKCKSDCDCLENMKCVPDRANSTKPLLGVVRV